MAFPRKPRRRDKNEFTEDWLAQRLVNTTNYLRALVPKEELELDLEGKREKERKKWERLTHVDSEKGFQIDADWIALSANQTRSKPANLRLSSSI